MWEQYVAVVDGVKLTVLMAMILANFGLGLAVSIKDKTFRLKEIADFMRSRVLPGILGYFAIGFVALTDSSWMPAVTVTWGFIIATLTGAILQSLKELGVNLPDSLGGK